MLIITQFICDFLYTFLPLLLDYKLPEGANFVVFNTKQPEHSPGADTQQRLKYLFSEQMEKKVF